MVVALALLVLAPALPHSRQWPTGRSSRATCSCSSSRAAHLPSPNKEEITPTAGLSVGVPHRHPSHFPGNRACSSQSLRTRLWPQKIGVTPLPFWRETRDLNGGTLFCLSLVNYTLYIIVIRLYFFHTVFLAKAQDGGGKNSVPLAVRN